MDRVGFEPTTSAHRQQLSKAAAPFAIYLKGRAVDGKHITQIPAKMRQSGTNLYE
jgi:hypothetical protein